MSSMEHVGIDKVGADRSSKASTNAENWERESQVVTSLPFNIFGRVFIQYVCVFVLGVFCILFCLCRRVDFEYLLNFFTLGLHWATMVWYVLCGCLYGVRFFLGEAWVVSLLLSTLLFDFLWSQCVIWLLFKKNIVILWLDYVRWFAMANMSSLLGWLYSMLPWMVPYVII